MGWKGIPAGDDVNENFKLKWTQTSAAINYFAFKEGKQMVNHIPNSGVLVGKNALYERMEDLVCLLNDGYYKPSELDAIQPKDFWPLSFRLDSAPARAAFYTYAMSAPSSQLWWARRAVSNWNGVKLITQLSQFAADLRTAFG